METNVEAVEAMDRAREAAAERQVWHRPLLNRLNAGSAELTVGALDDGVDRS
jgi:hypothetical protein